MRIASLAMYADPPEIAAANARLWQHIAETLMVSGLDDVPGRLDTALPYSKAWRHPHLLFAQACGYPYVTHLQGIVRMVATPVYSHAGCDGPDMCSFVIVRDEAPFDTLGDLRGARAAINQQDSNSGMNLFRAAIAPLAGGETFFTEVITTGSHRRSIAAVASGQADVAAIDCVTYGNIARFDPASLSGIRILARTPQGPGLPFITRAAASEVDVERLRMALRIAIDDAGLADVRQTLGLADIIILGDKDYHRLSALENEAIRLGYPEIA